MTSAVRSSAASLMAKALFFSTCSGSAQFNNVTTMDFKTLASRKREQTAFWVCESPKILSACFLSPGLGKMELLLPLGPKRRLKWMAVHLEFVLEGPLLSNQQSTAKGKANLVAWQAEVAGEAQKNWVASPLTGLLKAIIINFHDGSKPSVDVDNMSKPILDAMQKLIFKNDRQLRQAEIIHVEIGGAFAIKGVSKMIVDALQARNQFVYVRIEDPVIPYPLPK